MMSPGDEVEVRLRPKLEDIEGVSHEHGGFVNIGLAAVLLGVHRNRVYELIYTGTFTRYWIHGYAFVSLAEVLEYGRSGRHVGRPGNK